MQSREQQLLVAIREQPDDDPPRLEYAKWCDDWGDPRGEFIRTQCELARLSAHDDSRRLLERRELMILQECEADWLFQSAPPQGMICGIDPMALNHVFYPTPLIFQRGFVEGATITDLAALTELVPQKTNKTLLRQLRLEGMKPTAIEGLLETPGLERLRGLHLSELNLTCQQSRLLADCERLQGLTHLGVSQNKIGADGVAAIVDSPHLQNLHWLDLADNELGQEAIDRLQEWSPLDQLRFFDIGGNDALVRGGADLFETRELPQLEMLSAWQVGGADELIQALAAATHLKNLSHLLLARNRLDDEPVVSLLCSPVMQRVQVLWLEYNWLGNETAVALAESPYSRHVEDLNLGYNAIGNDGAIALAESTELHRLNALNLRMNPLSDEGALAIARSPHLKSLELLHLGGVDLSESTRTELTRRFGSGFAE